MTNLPTLYQLLVTFSLIIVPSVLLAADDTDCVEDEAGQCEQEVNSDRPVLESLAGPEQVENRLRIDSNQITPMFPREFAKGYFDWKARIKKDHGISLGGDYSAVYLSASDSPGEDSAFGGMYRIYGSWEATGDGKGNSGALIWKAEHRHAYGSNLAPGSFGFETGYIGLFEPPFSDQGTRLTNLYWRQRMKGGDLVFVGGYVDVTDYVDVYMLASPWTGGPVSLTLPFPPAQPVSLYRTKVWDWLLVVTLMRIFTSSAVLPTPIPTRINPLMGSILFSMTVSTSSTLNLAGTPHVKQPS
jgi:hypothetical protein